MFSIYGVAYIRIQILFVRKVINSSLCSVILPQDLVLLLPGADLLYSFADLQV